MTSVQQSVNPGDNQDDQLVIRCRQLVKVFKDFWLRDRVRAVDQVDLDIQHGEVFGLLGPNGSGKSTTIKMLLGLLRPTSGRIAVFGRRPDDVNTKKKIGYLPEETYLYRFLNARETLDYYGRLFHQDRHQRKRRIDMLLQMVGLEASQRRPVGEYSKGMQRRIGLAQALINDPQLLILDEPTTGLDPIGTRQIKDLILELSRRGKTILLCSHLLGDVEDVCDRVAIMYGGKIRSQGTVDELLVEQDSTLIHAPQLDSRTITDIEQLLEQRGLHIDKVEKPRQRLEKLFLDIVHAAQREGAATSGATSDGKIAAFLVDGERDAHMPESQQAAKVIDDLITGPTPPAPEAPAPSVITETPEPEKIGQDDAAQQVLDELTQEKTPAPKPAAPTSTQTTPDKKPAPSPVNDDKPDQRLIDDLIGKPDGDDAKDQ